MSLYKAQKNFKCNGVKKAKGQLIKSEEIEMIGQKQMKQLLADDFIIGGEKKSEKVVEANEEVKEEAREEVKSSEKVSKKVSKKKVSQKASSK
jgi:hypothetical protein